MVSNPTFAQRRLELSYTILDGGFVARQSSSSDCISSWTAMPTTRSLCQIRADVYDNKRCRCQWRIDLCRRPHSRRRHDLLRLQPRALAAAKLRNVSVALAIAP